MNFNQITKGLACVDAGTLFDRVIKCVRSSYRRIQRVYAL